MDLATQETIVVDAPAVTNEPTIDESLATNWATIKDDAKAQERDEAGKFKAPIIGENALKEVPRETTELSTETPQTTEVTPEKQAEDKAPSSWRKEAAAKWAALDPELKAEVLKRETDFHKGNEGYKAKAQFADEIQQIMRPHEQTFKSLGIPAPYAIKVLLESESMLRNGSQEQKATLFQKWARDYGVDLNVANIQNDPYVAQLQQERDNLLAARQFEQHQKEMAAQNQLTSTIEDFAKDHEHFDVVRVGMGSLLAANEAKDMQDAYDKACWANPDIRAILLAKQQEEAKAKAKLIAEEAKRKAAVNVTTRGTLPAAKAAGTLDDALRETAQHLGLIS